MEKRTNCTICLLTFCFLFYGISLFSQNLSLEKYYPEQKNIIQQLTGIQPVNTRQYLLSRSKKSERGLTRKYLSSLIKTIGLEPLSQKYAQPNIHPVIDLFLGPFKGANVYTILPSTNKSEEYVVIGAHFDTERNCPGAIDNGTGVAIIYSVVKELTKLEDRSKNVILIFFDQEEESLNGSMAFAKYLHEKKMKIHSVHTLDAMGWDRDGDRAIEIEQPTESLEKIYRNTAAELGIPLHTTNFNSTDHYSFTILGFNTIGLTDELANGDYAPYKDTPNDTYDTVNFEFVASCTNLVAHVFKKILSE